MQYKKVLIGNDDGISAPGIILLENLVSKSFEEVVVIAPDSNKSGASHSITLTNLLRAKEVSPKHYAVTGSPVDCVAFGLRYLFDEANYPDLVLSGINNDTNISEDVWYSGTVAVAREAALFGIPAIAFSVQRPLGQAVSWEIARHYVPVVLNKILNSFVFNPGTYISVNFPAVKVEEVKGIKVLAQGVRKNMGIIEKSIDPYGYPYYWLKAGKYVYNKSLNGYTDNCGLDDGYITVVPLSVNMTDYSSLDKLKGICDGEF